MTEPDDLKTIWKTQETEVQEMSIETLRARGVALTGRNRRRNLMGFAICAASGVFFAVEALRTPEPLIRAGEVIMIAGTVWMGWWIGRLWPETSPGAEAGARGLIEAQIAELRRQATSFGRLMVMGAPIFLGLAVMMAGMALKTRAPADLVPPTLLTALWLAGVWWISRRHVRAAERRIAELEALRRD